MRRRAPNDLDHSDSVPTPESETLDPDTVDAVVLNPLSPLSLGDPVVEDVSEPPCDLLSRALLAARCGWMRTLLSSDEVSVSRFAPRVRSFFARFRDGVTG